VVVDKAAAALERIRHIKAVVNQKVGNPVNLVDIDNAVGREYMVSLLEAMKTVTGAIQGDVDAAMHRLEAAYEAVEQAIATVGLQTTASGRSTSPLLNPYLTQDPGTVERSPAAAERPAADNDDKRWGTPVDVKPVIPAATEVPPPSNLVRPSVASDGAAASGYRATPLAADPEPLRTLADVPAASDLETSSQTGDPLYTNEIDAGLDQLLSEWSIFKKSGLFGTGPKGRAHPLFKTLSPLTVPTILAGRYDGSSDEIRQSVTDYMNGWRYEQGIVYAADEPFERYLRRVIRHIMDGQKARLQA
jgi:hypothetical protein